MRNCAELPPVVNVTPFTVEVVMVAPEMLGEVPSTTEPEPVMAYSPSTPLLS